MVNDFVEKHRVVVNYLCGCTAASVAEICTVPFDIVKTRSQIQGGLHSTDLKKSIYRRATEIVRKEGFFKLWTGLSPGLCRQLSYSGIRIVIYSDIKRFVAPDGSFPLWKACVTGFFAGSIAQAIASPFDLVKVQMQMDGLRKLQGQKPRIRNVPHGIITIYKKAGLAGLWKGWLPNAQKSGIVNFADIGTYDSMKHYLMDTFGTQHMFLIQFASSFTSALAAATLGTPADTIKCRVMNQPVDRRGKGLYYTGSVDCLLKTIRNEGVLAMYKGFFPYWFKLIPFNVIFWNTLEFNRRMVGVPTF